MHLQPRNTTTKGFNMFQHYPTAKDPQFPPSYPYPQQSLLTQHHYPFYMHSFSPADSLFFKRSLLNQGPFHPIPVKIQEPQVPYLTGFKVYETQNQNSSTQVKGVESCRPSEDYEEQVKRAYQKKIHQMCRRRVNNEQEIEEIKRYRSKRVKAYLAKKGKRTFEKKIVYDTRKKVADRRIRFKGKFINEYQARELLGLEGEDYSFSQLKTLMSDLRKHQ